ncbi:recombination protein RecR [Candidatus Dojkabacteria bacterium]|uniref:Recombination protein RecR n=1 Tax=Candidatus Dojkabacteria bacterium TaxID=2099670 RepID=A0A955L5N4_9BACT|nr:recombination protein RecR [Candidatus Dojkabacteria bacterium]
MKTFPQSVQKLIEHFSKLPGVGPKSASRMAFHVLNMPKESALDFADTIREMKENVQFCNQCFHLAEGPLCSICQDAERDDKIMMVVEDVLDLIAFESTGEFGGRYHVLGGVISPVNGIGPEELNIFSLFKRLKDSGVVQELIVATNPTLEGEATAMYIKQELVDLGNISITRIARGVPTGADLDYADRSTLAKALSGRIQL